MNKSYCSYAIKEKVLSYNKPVVIVEGQGSILP